MSVYRYAGIWNNETTYFPNFMVVSNNLAYVAKETITGGGEPSTNLAQWTYLPAGQQTAATFPIIEGNVSLSVNGTDDLVITAGSSNVLVNSPLLVDGLFNNVGNDPPPASGNVLTWTGSHIEWGTATSASGFPLQNTDATVSLTNTGENLLINNTNTTGNISINTLSNTNNYISIGNGKSATRLGDVDGRDYPWIALNDESLVFGSLVGASNILMLNPVGDVYIQAAKLQFYVNGASAPSTGDVFTWNSSQLSAGWVTPPSAVNTLNNINGSITINTPTYSGVQVSNYPMSNTITVDTNPAASGVYTANSSSTSVTIGITGMTSTGLVSITYVHAGGGGGSQYIKSITPQTGSVLITLNTVTDIGDQIIWNVLKYQ
jgi:hypothetical protein